MESLGDLDQATLAADGFFLDPLATAAGPEVAQFKQGGRLLIVRAGRPALYLPVTREAYLQSRIRYVQTTGDATSGAMDASVAEFERAMKELEKTDPVAARQARAQFAESRKLMTNLTSGGMKEIADELSGLSAEERRQPAVDPMGHPVVRLNPAYFDRARGRTAAHFVVVDIPSRYDAGEITLYQQSVIDEFLKTVPLTALVK